eukprot:scaffold438534_cov18-Prasinocladus_malaysianus.AAC.1
MASTSTAAADQLMRELHLKWHWSSRPIQHAMNIEDQRARTQNGATNYAFAWVVRRVRSENTDCVVIFSTVRYDELHYGTDGNGIMQP